MTLTAQDSAFFASPISDNLSKTPEGYLICHGCKIARTGVQDYLGEELGKDELYGKLVKVHRLAADVSDPDTLASAEAKPITDDHPAQGVDINTHAQHAKGEIHNARFENDHIVADLVVKDPILVSKIENKTKRELSCGYNYTLEKTADGKYKQTNIRINHVAVVEKGRAGKQVRINDSLPCKNRRKLMGNKQIFNAMLEAYAKDASAEELIAATKAIAAMDGEPKEDPNMIKALIGALTGRDKKAKDSDEDEPDKKKADDEDEAEAKKEAKADDKMDTLISTVQALVTALDKTAKDADEDESEAEKKADDEDADEDEKKEAKAEDKALKPILAKLDVKDRAVVLEALGIKRETSDTTAKIVKAVQTHAAKDASADDKSKIGDTWAERHNPHYVKK